MVQKSSRQVAEAEARGARPSTEAAIGATSAHRRERRRRDGDGGWSFELEQATTAEARTRHGQFRSRGSVVWANDTRRDETIKRSQSDDDGWIRCSRVLVHERSMYIRNCAVNTIVNMSNDKCVHYRNKLLHRSAKFPIYDVSRPYIYADIPLRTYNLFNHSSNISSFPRYESPLLSRLIVSV